MLKLTTDELDSMLSLVMLGKRVAKLPIRWTRLIERFLCRCLRRSLKILLRLRSSVNAEATLEMQSETKWSQNSAAEFVVCYCYCHFRVSLGSFFVF